MAYSIDLIYSKNQDFSNPLTETEAGQPQSVDLTNLDSNETYYTKAVLKNNGTVEDESTVETFTTLPAGTIALTHQSSTRQGSNYVVTYTYTSTYALSSSVLRCGTTIAAQGVISGNTITYTVSGLTPGDAYICQITSIDIYTESNTLTTTIIMPAVDYETQYFTITNESDSNNTISMAGYNNYANPLLLYWSVDNGTTWSSVQLSGTSVNITTLPARKSVIFYHYGHMCGEYTSGGSTSILPFSFRSTENISASGSLHSLAKGTNFVSNKDYSTHQWHGLFQGCTTLVSIANLKFSNTNVKEWAFNSMCSGCINLEDTMDLKAIITIGARGMENMFFGCVKLKEHPDVRNATTVGDNGMYFMCSQCTNLTTSPDVRSVTTVGVNGMHGMLSSCSALETPPDVRNVTTVDTRGMSNMLRACSVLQYAYAPNISVWSTTNFTEWLGYVAASGTIYKPSGLSIPTNTTSGVPTGWTTQDY